MHRFPMEQWLEDHDGSGRWDISRSGYQPQRLRELLDGQALDRLLDAPQRYAENQGAPRLRQLVAALWPGQHAAAVVTTSGTTESNWLAVQALVQPGDEVVVIDPTYQQAPLAAEARGARLRRLRAREDSGWRPDLDRLAEMVTPRTRMIYVCQPANPTGICLDAKEIAAIVAIADRVGAWILADEIYRGTEHATGEWAPSFAGLSDRVIVTGSLSKTFGLPGLRTGWLLAQPPVIDTVAAIREYINAWLARPAQQVAQLVLEPARRAQIVRAYRERLAGNLPVLTDWVATHADRARLVPPTATAVGFLHLDLGPAVDSFAVARTLRERASVLVVPGGLFGGGDGGGGGVHRGIDGGTRGGADGGHVRVTYGVDRDHLAGALDAIDTLMAEGAPAGRAR